jgi:molybdenum cofactor cytidylyltransferase
MGVPKMLLPWRQNTVLGHVISVFASAGLEDILVVTGAERERIERLVEELSINYPVRCAFNDVFASQGMLSSIQCALADLARRRIDAAMIGLGDQPQVEERTVRVIREAHEHTTHPLIVPSHGHRRGHPWLIGSEYWKEFVGMSSPQTPRDFLSLHTDEILYVEIESASILADLDTPDHYLKAQSG